MSWGCVENRFDPLMLGRLKVRIVGIHTNNKTILPTEDLPWATVLQPVTSAAMSGIGHAPVGPVEGSWVAVQFLDEEQQYPIVIGTIAGIPGLKSSTENAEFYTVEEDNVSTLPENVLTDSQGVPVTDSQGTPILTGNDSSAKYLGQMTKDQYDKMKSKIAQIESGGRSTVENQLGYIGTYQFGTPALEDLGYLKKGTFAKNKSNSAMNDPNNWTGKNGITSKEMFKNNAAEQEIAMDGYLKINYKRISSQGVDVTNVPPEKMAGLLGAAHNQGSGAVKKMLSGSVTADGNGMTTTKYFKDVHAAVGGTTNENPTYQNIYDTAIDKGKPAVAPGKSPYDVSSSPQVVNKKRPPSVGFTDPNNKYPKPEYKAEPDTSRLSRGQRLNRTIVGERTAHKIPSISVANSSVTWKEPDPAYNAKYPFNHVFESESGHTMEFDDTPGSERIAMAHAVGTYSEIDNLGNHSSRIKGSRVVVVDENELLYVQGSGHVCVDGDLSVIVNKTLQLQINSKCNVHVIGDCALQVDGKMDTYVKGNMNTVVDGNYYVNVKGATNIKSTGSLNVNAASKLSLRSEDQVGIDGFQVHLNSGKADTAQTQSFAAQTFSPTIKQPQPISYEESRSVDMEDTVEARKEAMETPAAPVTTTPQPVNPAVPKTVTTECDFVGQLDPSTQLSTNFTIGSLCRGSSGIFPFGSGQHNFSDMQIACNMKKLALNVIEPIFDKFSSYGPVINSCIRKASGTKTASGNISQHEKGQAVDLGFSKIRGDRPAFVQLAKEILEAGIPYDQFLLEYRDNGSIWIHISYADSLRKQVLTLNNDKTVGQGIILVSKK